MMQTENKEQSFLKSVKGKVIFGFMVGCLALGASWIISKGAFDKMLATVDQLSTPNEKLRLVNVIFKDILLLDQLQNETTAGSRTNMSREFKKRSARLQLTLDTLALWCADSPKQADRIDSIRKILQKRVHTLDDYVKVRSVLVNNRDLQDKVKSISGLITDSAEKRPDSTIITREKRTTTTTIFKEQPAVAENKPEESEKKGIFNKLFKGRKTREETEEVPPAPVVVQKEEVKVSIDTLTIAKHDSVIQKVEAEVKNIASGQLVRTSRFVDRERQLMQGENILINQLMDVMREVEEEIIDQMNTDNLQAKVTVTRSINNIGMIILGVFTLSALLGYLIFADITQTGKYRKELVLAKEEAEYHSQAKQRFLSNMSHEIRTPLQSIIGYTELVKNQEKPGTEELDIISKSSEHLLYLVNEILDYSRIISDRFEFAEENFNLAEALEEVISILRPEANRKELLLTLHNSLETETWLLGDPFRLKQILHNLLGNAIKFTHEGQVELYVERVQGKGGPELRLEVRDTGIGLSKDQIKRVFNQFEQGSAGIAPKYGGAGLGLSIVKSLVVGQGGRIDVQSEPGKRTSFTVWLPYRKGEVPESEVAASNAIGELDYRGKIWIVDDDKFILDWISAVLERHQVRYKRFSSGIEALNHPWDPEVTMVLADMRMPGMSGAELCRQLRKKSGDKVKYYAATAMAMPEEKERILELGFEDVLMKPFKSSDILRVLQLSNPSEGAAGSATIIPAATVSKTVVSLSGTLASEGAQAASAETSSPVPAGAKVRLDLSALSAMTMGDEELLKDSLEQFVEDTLADLARVREHLQNGRKPQELKELFHKMAGRTGQVGAVELGIRMRSIEAALNGDQVQPYVDEMNAIVEAGYELVDEITAKYIS